jgi:hypothetical protein
VHRRQLTPRQVAVLQWVADGCAGRAWPDEGHKQTARALESRGFVKVRRREGGWHADLLPDGQHYLDHGDYPRTANSASTPAATALTQRGRPPELIANAQTVSRPRPAGIRLPGPVLAARSPSEELIAEVQAAGGTLTIDAGHDHRKLNRLDAQIRAVRSFSKLPLGLMLHVESPRWGIRVLTIEPLPDWIRSTSQPIHVAVHLRDPHPAVATLRDADHLPVAGPPRARALRLLQALTTAAAAQGYTVTASVSAKDRHGQTGRDPAYLCFDVRGHDIAVHVIQQGDRTDHVATVKELAEQQRNSWYRIPKYDHAPSQRLKISVSSRFEYQQATWSDSAKTRLEDKLPQIFREIEIRSELAERHRLAEEERTRQKELEQRRRIDRATAKLIESHRIDVLNAQMTAWRQARQLDDYLAAMATRIGQLDDPSAIETASQWLAWAKAYAARTDPLNGTLAIPADPEPTTAALAPFMERSSPWSW